jgi:hypothetical protein
MTLIINDANNNKKEMQTIQTIRKGVKLMKKFSNNSFAFERICALVILYMPLHYCVIAINAVEVLNNL